MCKKRNFTISKFAIHRIIADNKNNAPPLQRRPPERSKQAPTPYRTSAIVAKVKLAVACENPKTQRTIAKQVGVSQRTVGRIISQNLGLVKRHKAKVHALLPRHIAERRTNCRKLYERHLSGDKWMFVVTLDEAWVYLDDCNKVRAIMYRKRDENGRSDWFKQCRESFPKGFMIAAGYCYNGKLTLHKVEKNVKINAAYYQANVLEPIYRDQIPALYGAHVHKVWLHQDKASSHTAKSTQAYLARMATETGINAIPYSEIPVISPDASPMDFCGFGLLNRALGNRRPRTLDGLWKVCEQEWAAMHGYRPNA